MVELDDDLVMEWRQVEGRWFSTGTCGLRRSVQKNRRKNTSLFPIALNPNTDQLPLEPRQLAYQLGIARHARKMLTPLLAKGNPLYAPVIQDLHDRASAALAAIGEFEGGEDF